MKLTEAQRLYQAALEHERKVRSLPLDFEDIEAADASRTEAYLRLFDLWYATC